MSQAELAERIGTKQPGIARIESGKCNARLSTLVDIAEALGASVKVDMAPLESVLGRARTVPWWEPEFVWEPVPDQHEAIVFHAQLQVTSDSSSAMKLLFSVAVASGTGTGQGIEAPSGSAAMIVNSRLALPAIEE